MPMKATSIRFSDEEHEQLRFLAKQHGQSFGEYVRAKLFAKVHADERNAVAAQMKRVEKALTALVQLGIETVDFQREGFPTVVVESVQARARARTAKIVKDLGLE